MNKLSKILEKLIYNRLIQFLQNNNIINTIQYGFLKKHNNTHATLYIYIYIYIYRVFQCVMKIKEMTNKKHDAEKIKCDNDFQYPQRKIGSIRHR